MRKLLFIPILLFFFTKASAQDSIIGINEFGFGLNRFVPALKNEVSPFRFSVEYRRRWKETEKFQHFVTIRAAGNYNRVASFKPFSSKTFVAFELGHWSRRKKENTPWHLSWGVSAGYYRTIQKVTPLNKNPYNPNMEEPFSRNTYRLGIAPKLAVEYAFSERFYVQLILAVGVATKYFGNTEKLEFNGTGTYSAQFPALSVHYVF